jgi:hypothetical protein
MTNRLILKGTNSNNSAVYIAIDTLHLEEKAVAEVTVFDSSNATDKLDFSIFADALTGKWQYGETIEFSQPHQQYHWAITKENAPFENFVPKDKCAKLQRQLAEPFVMQISMNNRQLLHEEIKALAITVNTETNYNKELLQPLVAMGNKLKQGAEAFRSFEKEGIINNNLVAPREYRSLNASLDEVFNAITKLKDGIAINNYNNLYEKIEKCYLLSKTSDQWKETRDGFIATQQELNKAVLDKLQRAELNRRLQDAFDNLSKRQSAHKEVFEEESSVFTQAFEEKLQGVTTQINSKEDIDLVFNKLILLQNELKDAQIKRADKNTLFDKIQEVFVIVKAKKKEFTGVVFETAKEKNELVLRQVAGMEVFKEARVVLIDWQKELKDMLLTKKQKDELFGSIRKAFDELNEKQDNYFKQQRKDRVERIEQTGHNLQRVLFKKEEGIKKLYETRDGLQYKIKLIKPSSGSQLLIDSFNERLEQLNDKIKLAEEDILNLRDKVKNITTA